MKESRQQLPNGSVPPHGREKLDRRNEEEAEKISLPPIRTMFPDLDRDISTELVPLAVSTPYGPSPEYIYSRQFQRSVLHGTQEKQLDTASQVPRTYNPSPTYLPVTCNPSPAGSRPHSPISPWSHPGFTNSNSSSPNSGVSVIRVPMSFPTTFGPPNGAEACRTPPPPLELPIRTRHGFNDDGMSNSSRRHSLLSSGSHRVEVGGREYHRANYDYGCHHPSRPQSLSTSYPAGIYRHHYPETYLHMDEYGANGDVKQRKRRGNLPKETTEILRTWFHGHLHHPYPTEDEKQDMVKRTGLQLNQISNWFINARRRHLPGLVNDARTESEVINRRTVDGTTLLTRKRGSAELDPGGDGESYDERFGVDPKRRRRRRTIRGSV